MTAPLTRRLEEAAEGARELDAAIWYAIHEPDVDYPGIRTEQTEQGPREVLTCELGSKWADDVGHVTTSLDAALALAEQVLPGWCVAQIGQGDDRKWFVELREGYRTSFNRVAMSPVGVPTAALAFCIAILKANHKDKP